MAARAPWGRPFVQEQNLAAFHSLYVQVQALTRSTLYSPRGTSCQTGLLKLSGQLILGCKKALQWTVGKEVPEWGAEVWGGENPPKSLEFKNLKPTRLLPPPPSSPADCSVVLSPPSHPPSLSLGVPSPVCLNPSVQHTRSVFAFRESLSVILLLETQSSLTEIIAKGRDGRR